MLSTTLRSSVLPFVLSSVVLLAQEPQPAHRLNLVIVEGEGALNNIKLRTARETIVQVEDENHKPVAGAVVAFLLPGNGPGGTFVNGGKNADVVTDNFGRAAMPRLQLNSAGGRYEIRVHASYQGLEADAAITQTTVAAGGISTAAVVGIIGAIAAAGAVAAVVATKGGSKSTPASTPTMPSGTIGAGGGIMIGPPH